MKSNPFTTLLENATSPEEKLKITFAAMNNNECQRDLLDCLINNIDILKESFTKYQSRREEFGKLIVQALVEYPEFYRCLDMCFEDAFAYLRDYTAKVLKTDKNDSRANTFSYYCSEDVKYEQRAAREIEQFSEDELQENPDSWFTLAALASVFRTGVSLFWPIGYALKDKTITKTFLTLLIEYSRDVDTAIENYEIFVSTIINQFYERADILEDIDTFISEGYGDVDVVLQTKKLQSCSPLQAKSFWKRLAEMHSSRYNKALRSDAIIHLYSLCSIVDNHEAIVCLAGILEQEKGALLELVSIIQEILDQ
jgi:hypothetical protein